jgi:Putative AphA-like transcriptional regulator
LTQGVSSPVAKELLLKRLQLHRSPALDQRAALVGSLVTIRLAYLTIFAECVERAIVKGLLQPVDTNGAGTRIALETTSAGQIAIVELLRRPIARSTGGFIRACMTAKLCFLHHLPLPERGAQGENLARLYRDAIKLLLRLQRLPRPLAASALHDLRHEIVCMESALVWLDGMATWRPQLPQQWAAE